MSACDVVIVGAGPGGSAAAATLAAAGVRAVVLEKDRFPRAKVCGEFLSGSALADLRRLGVLADIEADAERIERGFLHLPRGRSVAFALPIPALGISRARLDDLLARRAAALGAEIRHGVRVTSIERAGPGFQVRCVEGGRTGALAARSVIGAWGRWDALDRGLERRFLKGGSPFFGWSRDFVGGGDRMAGEVHLFVFPGGYCGLSRVESGATNMAGVISARARGKLAGGWDPVVAHVRASSPALDAALTNLRAGPGGFLGIGPVFFAVKPPVENGILMVGDAAGVIDPFSGEGQAAALRSGILAAEGLVQGLARGASMDEVARGYSGAWTRCFSRRFGWGSVFRRFMLHPAAARVGARFAGPRLVRFAMQRVRTR